MVEEQAGTETGTEEGAAAAAAPEAPPQTVFQTMRDKLDAGERIFPDAVAEEAGDAAKEPAEGEEAASEEGTAEGEAGGEGEDAGTVGEEAESGEKAEGEGAEAGAGAEEGADDAEGTVTIELSGRNEGDVVEIEVDSADTVTIEALRRNKNEGMRREELNRAMDSVKADRDEIDEIDIAMSTDPADFLLNKVDKSFRVQVAKALLLDDEVHAELQEILDSAEDPKERELLRLRLKNEREETSKTAGAQVRAARAAKNEVRRIGSDIATLVPGDMEQKRGQRFQRAALTVAEEITIETGKYPTRDQIVEGLREDGLLERFGIDPGAAPSKEAGTRAGSKAVDASKAAAGKDDAHPAAGLKKGQARRKSIAGSAGAGAGAPGASIELPASTSVKDRIAHVRKHGLGSVLAGK